MHIKQNSEFLDSGISIDLDGISVINDWSVDECSLSSFELKDIYYRVNLSW